MESQVLLEIKNLKTHFFTDEGLVEAVNGVDFTAYRNRTLCVVGESGCGKSVMARSILQVVDRPGRIVDGEILFYPPESPGTVVDLAALPSNSRQLRDVRGKDIAMIFQEPMSSMSPIHTIGDQIGEVLRFHMGMPARAQRDRAIELLGLVGIPRPEEHVDSFTFQLSGGMRQRAMIAMALACNPSLLIADEPTTALDVTTQAQILELMRDLQQQFGMAIMLITHDLGVVAEMAEDVIVMYLGQIVERGTVFDIFDDPKHPYTQALLRSIPAVGQAERQRLDSIRGMIPSPYNRPPGCQFHNRCDHFMPDICDQIVPPNIRLSENRDVRCLLYDGSVAKPAVDQSETR